MMTRDEKIAELRDIIRLATSHLRQLEGPEREPRRGLKVVDATTTSKRVMEVRDD